MHGIEVVKGFGVLTAKTENPPPPANPKTVYIAVLSAIVTLKKLSRGDVRGYVDYRLFLY